jgi:hypothetical protein
MYINRRLGVYIQGGKPRKESIKFLKGERGKPEGI